MKIKNPNYSNLSRIVFFLVLVFLNNNILHGQEDMQDASIVLSFSDESNTKMITATVTDPLGNPAAEVELYFYVQRTFSLLPIGKGFNETDENGILEIQFPNDLPGDMEGNLTIITKIIESDLYNDLTIETIKKWGIPTHIKDTTHQRSLWAASANAPLTLIILVSGMILAIWFINCYIIFVLYKISKIKPIIS